MSQLINLHGVAYEICQCGACGVLFIVAQEVRILQRRQGGYSRCPNGHQWGYDPQNSEEARTRRERDLLKQQLAQMNDALDGERNSRWKAERERAAAESKLKASKKRAAAAVCPCCNRSFVALRRHLATKHPGYSCEAV